MIYLILQPIEIRTPERREAESEDENGPVIGQEVEEPVVEEAVEEVIFWLFFFNGEGQWCLVLMK